MTQITHTSSSFRRRAPRLARAVLIGTAAGWIAALLDVRQGATSLFSTGEVALLALQGIGRLGLAGAVLGTLAAVLVDLGRIAAKRSRRFEGAVAAAPVTLAAVPGIVYVAAALFRGGFTSSLPARPLLVVLLATLLIGLFWLGARLLLTLVERADRGELSRPSLLGSILGLALLALALRWCDGHLYRRLYLYLHGMLGIGTLGAFALALRLGFARLALVRGPIGPVAALAATLVLAWGAWASIDARQTVKNAAWDHTATLADLLRITWYARSHTVPVTRSPEAAEVRRERAARVRQIEAGHWPAFRDAHILLVTVDALRADRLGVYGHTERELTPKIDAWAVDKGVVFERAYCAAPHSSFSTTSLHTSRYTHEEAMLGREIRHQTLAEVLRGAGYETRAFYTQGIFFTDGDLVGHYRRSRFGFEQVVHGAFPPRELTDRAVVALEEIVRGGRPSFLWVHYFNVHEPYESTRFGDTPAARYDGEIFETDGEVVRLIERAGELLGGQLIVFFSSDHGEEFGDHGGYYHGSSLYEEQVRVPLIIATPGGAAGRVPVPVSLTALAPTALELVGVEPPGGMAGPDLRPALFGDGGAFVAEPVFASVMRHHMIVDWPLKLIVDPSRGLFELYDLVEDPGERVNRYDVRKQDADRLLGNLHGWLEEIGKGEHEARTALNLGHMHDTSAVPEIARIAQNSGAPREERIEALELLGEIRERSVIPVLETLLEDPDDRVAVAAALALGRMGNTAGRELLVESLYDSDPAQRDKAALTLGRMGDRAAARALTEALGRNDVKTREQAIRMLGRLGDPSTVDALLESLAEDRTRYLTVLALGKIGHPKALEPLLEVIEQRRYTDVRGYAVVGLGWLGERAAIPRLTRLLAEEPEIKWTTEALVRLGAVGEAPLFGLDAVEGLGAAAGGLGRCTAKPKIIHGDYLTRTTCRTTGGAVSLSFEAAATGGATVFVSARHLGRDEGTIKRLDIAVDGAAIGAVEIAAARGEYRLETSGDLWGPGLHRVTLKLRGGGTFELDHLLVLAR